MKLKKALVKRRKAVNRVSETREQEAHAATNLSPNTNEAIEESLVKASSDEARPTPQ